MTNIQKKQIASNKQDNLYTSRSNDVEGLESGFKDIPFHTIFTGDPNHCKAPVIPIVNQQCGMRFTKDGITIFHFQHEQSKKTLSIHVDVKGIHSHPMELISVDFRPTSVKLDIYKLGDVDYKFGINHLSHEILPKKCSFIVKEDKITMTLVKLGAIHWDDIFYCHPSVKEEWESQFQEVIQAFPLAFQMQMMANAWEASHMLCDSYMNWINPPFPFRSMIPPTVKTLEDVIDHLKKSLNPETDGGMKYFYLGSAMLSLLQEAHKAKQTAGKENTAAAKKRQKDHDSKKKSGSKDKKQTTPVSPADKKRLEGNEFFKNQNYHEALQCYTEAININPTKAVLYTNRAACYSKLNLTEQCFTDAYQANNLDPTSVKAYYYLGKSTINLSMTDLAVKYLVKAKALNPSCIEIDNELKKANKILLMTEDYMEAMRKKEIKQAVKLLEDLNKLSPVMGGAVRLKLYDRLCNDGQYDRVIYYCMADLVYDSQDYQAYYFLGKCSFYLGYKEEALNFLKESVKMSFYFNSPSQPAGESIKPQTDKLSKKINDFFSFREKGDKAMKNNKVLEAVKWYLESVKVDPGNRAQNANLYCKIGNIKINQENYKEAIKYFSLAVDNDKEYIEPLLQRIKCYEVSNQYKEAILDAQTICEIDPTYEHCKLLKELLIKLKNGKKSSLPLEERRKLAKQGKLEGNKLQDTEQYHGAVKCYTESLLWDPDVASTYLKRSECFMKLKNYILSYDDATAALVIDPDNLEVLLQVAKCCLNLGRGEEALPILRKARKLDPRSKDILRELNNAQQLAALRMKADKALQCKNYKAASLILKDVVEIAKGSVSLSFKLAECLIYDQNIDDADYIASSVMPAKKYHPEQECIFGMCRFHKGDLEMATKHLKRALEILPSHAKSTEILTKVEQISKIKKEGNNAFKNLNWDSAISLYNTGLKIDPANKFMNSVFQFNIGMVHFKQSQFSVAEKAFSLAVSCRDDYVKAFLKRAECHLELGYDEKAVEDYQKVLKINPKEKHEKLQKLLQKYS